MSAHHWTDLQHFFLVVSLRVSCGPWCFGSPSAVVLYFLGRSPGDKTSSGQSRSIARWKTFGFFLCYVYFFSLLLFFLFFLLYQGLFFEHRSASSSSWFVMWQYDQTLMKPADLDRVRAALEGQGALLGQHQSQFEAVQFVECWLSNLLWFPDLHRCTDQSLRAKIRHHYQHPVLHHPGQLKFAQRGWGGSHYRQMGGENNLLREPEGWDLLEVFFLLSGEKSPEVPRRRAGLFGRAV